MIRFLEIAETVGLGRFVWDLDTADVWWDDASARMLGFGGEGWHTYEQWLSAVADKREIERAQRRAAEAARRGTAYSDVIRYHLAGGVRFVISIGAIDPADTTRMVGVNFDTTDLPMRVVAAGQEARGDAFMERLKARTKRFEAMQ